MSGPAGRSHDFGHEAFGFAPRCSAVTASTGPDTQVVVAPLHWFMSCDKRLLASKRMKLNRKSRECLAGYRRVPDKNIQKYQPHRPKPQAGLLSCPLLCFRQFLRRPTCPSPSTIRHCRRWPPSTRFRRGCFIARTGPRCAQRKGGFRPGGATDGKALAKTTSVQPRWRQMDRLETSAVHWKQ